MLRLPQITLTYACIIGLFCSVSYTSALLQVGKTYIQYGANQSSNKNKDRQLSENSSSLEQNYYKLEQKIQKIEDELKNFEGTDAELASKRAQTKVDDLKDALEQLSIILEKATTQTNTNRDQTY